MAMEPLQVLTERIMAGAKGWVEAVIIASPDGIPIAHNSKKADIDVDKVAAVVAAIGGAAAATVDLLGSDTYDRLDLRLGDGRYVLVRRHGKDYVICMTRPNPNLGLVNLVLDALLSKK
jgi:predicted regulator of Ras-like GTPase activity (Roadblock/LC7/MglB family)